MTDALTTAARSRELYDARFRDVCVFTDRLFAGLMVIQVIGCVVTALVV